MGSRSKSIKYNEGMKASCRLCLDNDNENNGESNLSMAVATSSNVYLALPMRGLLEPFHVLIVPKQHLKGTLEADEPTWEEIRVTLF